MTREEAIDIVRKNYPHVGVSGSQFETALRNLIPELRESEDDEKRLLDLNSKRELLNRWEKAKAYLEKQKEQKPKNILTDNDSLQTAYLKGQTDVIEDPEAYGLQKEQKLSTPKYRVGEVMRTKKEAAEGITDGLPVIVSVDDNYYYCTNEKIPISKQEEYEFPPMNMRQKAMEWSEDYDEENLQTRFAFYTYKDDPSVLYLSNVFVEETSRNHGFGTRILKAAEKVAEAIGAITIRLKVKQDSPANNWYRKHGYAYMTFEDGYDWLEKNLEYMKPNKQEWSEEDEDMLNSCISSIEEAKENRYAYKETDGDTSYDHEIDWLKLLRPKPQQNMSIGFMTYLDEHRPDGKMCLSNAECNEIETAFKNQSWDTILRYVEKYQPHWKPNEEQIATLEKWLKDKQFDGASRYAYPIFESLYEQLKKLM